jgi:hypothetical protein
VEEVTFHDPGSISASAARQAAATTGNGDIVPNFIGNEKPRQFPAGVLSDPPSGGRGQKLR